MNYFRSGSARLLSVNIECSNTAVNSSHTVHLDSLPLLPVPVLLMGIVGVLDESSIVCSSSSLGKPPKVEGAGSIGVL